MSKDRDPTPIESEWRGTPRYQCRLCPFDTLDEQQFVNHFAHAHPPLEVIEGVNAPVTPPEPKPQRRKPPVTKQEEDPEPEKTIADLHQMTRKELNHWAGWFGLTEDAESFATKDELITAIEAANKEGE